MKQTVRSIWVIVAIALAVCLYFFLQQPGVVPEAGQVPFSRAPSYLVYSKHARCRMECRHVNEAEVVEVLRTGRYDPLRTKKSSRGTSYAIEGRTHDAQLLRLVVAPASKNRLIVVTVIDLEHDYPCHCD